jgi:hypothetical protein
VAAGRPLPWTEQEIKLRGHALECRLYAEDPDQDDLPSPGRILAWSMPEGPGVRVDSGVAASSEVSVHYDPLLAKIVTWGGDRAESVERMADALRHTVALGVTTNLARLRAIVGHPAFLAGALHTGHRRALGATSSRAASDGGPGRGRGRLHAHAANLFTAAARRPWTLGWLRSWRCGLGKGPRASRRAEDRHDERPRRPEGTVVAIDGRRLSPARGSPATFRPRMGTRQFSFIVSATVKRFTCSGKASPTGCASSEGA